MRPDWRDRVDWSWLIFTLLCLLGGILASVLGCDSDFDGASPPVSGYVSSGHYEERDCVGFAMRPEEVDGGVEPGRLPPEKEVCQ